MCGRYYIDIANDEMSYVNNFSEFEYEQNYNVAPQNQAPCIIDNNLVIANWGYFPDWLKSQSNPRPLFNTCLLYTSPSPRDISGSRMPSSA